LQEEKISAEVIRAENITAPVLKTDQWKYYN
jgi:hypothetical protein